MASTTSSRCPRQGGWCLRSLVRSGVMPSRMRERGGRRRRPVLADRRLRWALPAQPGRCLCAHTSPVTSFTSSYLSSPYLSSLKRETERLTGSETHPLCREWDGNTPDTQAPHAPKQSTLSKTCPCRAPKQSTCPCRALYARTARAEAVDVPTPSPCCAVQTAGAPVMAEIRLRRTDGWRTGHSRNPVAQYRQLARR